MHPKLQGQELPAVLASYLPRLNQHKKLQPDAIQNCENAIADLVSKGAPFAGELPCFAPCFLSAEAVSAHSAAQAVSMLGWFRLGSMLCFENPCQHTWLSKPWQHAFQRLVGMLCCSSSVSRLDWLKPCQDSQLFKAAVIVVAGKYVLETGHMSGNNTFVFSAKRRGNNTPVVCKFFADEGGFRREMKFYERVHTGDFVPGQPHLIALLLQS